MIMSNKENQELVEHLQGTCLCINEALYQLFAVDTSEITNELEMCDYIDNHIFCCSICGWWYEVGYWNSKGYEDGEACLDCMPEEDELEG